MNIKRAKQEIIDTVRAYLAKDTYGEYVIPPVHQRPILLLGAPGIGKTQIMQQVASECRIALVSYTITHHTRQSAIGLPFIAHRIYGGEEKAVTEYTLSEIVASVYQKMEKTGLSEGILFIDEVNCVSETLAPAMLQFLQGKAFGNHQVPKGWIIVTAGNPPEYNKSVRDFDVVTLDRLKKIDVEPDFDAFKEYAYTSGIHPAIISYLNTRPLHFYKMETTVDGRLFATPRGWEDLSRLLKVYEEMGLPMSADTVVQYIQHPEIARDFASYLELFYKYEADYQIDEIFKGNIPDILLKKLSHASFDERLSLLGLITSRCQNAFRSFKKESDDLNLLHGTLIKIREPLLAAPDPSASGSVLKACLKDMRREREEKERRELLSRPEKESFLRAEAFIEEAARAIPLQPSGSEDAAGEAAFSLIRASFAKQKEAYDASYENAASALEHAFDFLEAAFGGGQEMVLFLTDLNMDRESLSFLSSYPCERYDRYSQSLLLEDKRASFLRRMDELGL